MPRAILLVQSRPSSPERDAEYNEWYDNTHLAEVTAIPGFTGARRFRLSDKGLMPPPDGTLPYLAIYELDCDDIDAAMNELVTRSADGRIRMSDAIELDPPPLMALYEIDD